MFILVWGFFTFCFLKVAASMLFWGGLSITSAAVIAASALLVMYGATGLVMARRAMLYMRILVGTATRSEMIQQMLLIVAMAALAQAGIGLLLVIGFDREVWDEIVPQYNGHYWERGFYSIVLLATIIGTPVLLHGLVNVFLLSRGPGQDRKL